MRDTDAQTMPMNLVNMSTSTSLPPISKDAITELWRASRSTHFIADICFVHGLMTHPLETWVVRIPQVQGTRLFHKP